MEGSHSSPRAAKHLRHAVSSAGVCAVHPLPGSERRRPRSGRTHVGDGPQSSLQVRRGCEDQREKSLVPRVGLMARSRPLPPRLRRGEHAHQKTRPPLAEPTRGSVVDQTRQPRHPHQIAAPPHRLATRSPLVTSAEGPRRTSHEPSQNPKKPRPKRPPYPLTTSPSRPAQTPRVTIEAERVATA